MEELKVEILRDIVPTRAEVTLPSPLGSFAIKRIESDTRRFDPQRLGALYRKLNAPEIAWLPDPKHAPTLVEEGLLTQEQLLEPKVGNLTVYPRIKFVGP